MINQEIWCSSGNWQAVCCYRLHDATKVRAQDQRDCVNTAGLYLVWWWNSRGLAWAGRKGDRMLWTIAVVLVILWLLGFVSGYSTNYYIHILMFFAIIAMLIQIEDDCRGYGSGHMRKRYLKRRWTGRSGKILPKLAMLSREKVSQRIISPQSYKQEWQLSFPGWMIRRNEGGNSIDFLGVIAVLQKTKIGCSIHHRVNALTIGEYNENRE